MSRQMSRLHVQSHNCRAPEESFQRVRWSQPSCPQLAQIGRNWFANGFEPSQTE